MLHLDVRRLAYVAGAVALVASVVFALARAA